MNEIWQDILDYEGYQVSNLGGVRSLDRMVKCKGGVRTVKGKILNQATSTNGYQQVQLCKNGNVKNFLVHRLIYAAFNGDIPEGMQVNHIDECKTNNRLENLNLMTQKENINYGTCIERRAKALKNDPKRSKPVVGYDENGDVVVTFPSAREAERNGYKHASISSCCSGEKPQYKGLIWRFKNGDC